MNQPAKPPTYEDLYAIYCEAYSAAKSGHAIPFANYGMDLARSAAKMLGVNAATTPNTAPVRFHQFPEMVKNYLDADWSSKSPYGPPR